MTGCNGAGGGTDESLAAVLDGYLADVEAGSAPPLAELLARHPHLADGLRECLDALDLIRRGAGAAAPPRPQADGHEPDPPGEAPGTLGDFRIVREVGRGGMGVVYEAEQVSLGRKVALKVLPFAATMDPRQLARFHNEARAAASLEHPHIVPVYFVGCERAVHFYAMKFIDGRTLAEVLAQLRVGPASVEPTAAYAPADADTSPKAQASTQAAPRDAASFRQVAEWGAQAAAALDCAHQMGVVHRDVKPANLMLDGSGRLWVTDFGLAQVQSDSRLTQTGDLVGTLRYMSPEQALANRVVIDHRSDVYSLGATLYELLTLRPVFEGQDRAELLRQIAFDEPVPPRRINKAIPAELETIALKALEKAPADRYATAQEVADDLRRFLEDKPIQARRPTWSQRATKWARRHQAVVRSAVALLIVTVAALVISTVSITAAYQSEAEQRQAAQKAERKEADQREAAQKAQAKEADQRRLAEKRRDLAESRLYAADMLLARLAWEQGNTYLVQQRLAAHIPAPGQRDLRGWEWHYFQGLCNQAKHTLRTDGVVAAIASSPDGRQLAVSARDWATDAMVFRVWEVATGREIFRLSGTVGTGDFVVNELAWSPDGKRLAGWNQSEVRVWEIATGKTTFTRVTDTRGQKGLGADQRETFLPAWSPDGKWLAIGRTRDAIADSVVEIWSADNDKPPQIVPFAQTRLYSLAWGPDSQQLATLGLVARVGPVRGPASVQRRITVLKIAAGQPGSTIDAGLGGLVAGVGPVLAWAPDGRRIALGIDRSLKIWDLQTGEQVLSVVTEEQPRPFYHSPSCVSWAPDGRYVLVGMRRRASTVWDTVTKQKVLDVENPDAGMVGAGPAAPVFAPNGCRLASGVEHGMIKVWDLATGETLRFRGHTTAVMVVAWTPDGKQLASGDAFGTVKIWDVVAGEDQEALTLRQSVGGSQSSTRIAWAADSRRLATVSANSPESIDPVTIWDTDTGRELYRFGGRMSTTAVAWAPDDQSLAVADYRGFVKIWSPVTWREKHTFRGYSSAGLGIGQTLGFSSDGKRLAALVRQPTGAEGRGPTEDRVAVWQLQTGKEVPGPRSVGVLSPDGQSLAYYVRPGPGRIAVHDLATGQDRALFQLGEKGAWPLAWSADGTKLAGGVSSHQDQDWAITIWEATSGKKLLTFRGHTALIHSLAWGPDGTRLASAGADRTVRIWDTASGMELLSLRGPSCFVGSLAWSPDGKRLAAGGDNGEIKVWDVSRSDRARAAPAGRLRKANGVDHNNRGDALAARGRLDEAIAEYRQALGLEQGLPEACQARCNLGNALAARGRLDEAIAEYRQVIGLKWDYPDAHNNLGSALARKGELDEAISKFGTAIHLRMKHYPASRIVSAVGLAGGVSTPWQAVWMTETVTRADFPVASWLMTEMMIGADFPVARHNLRVARQWKWASQRLPSILKGEAQPAGAAERLRLAAFCQQPFKGLYATAARFYGEAFADKPQLAEDLRLQHRYNAACAVALVGCGKGKDAAGLADEERARLRLQALTWLRADLAAYDRLLEKGPAPARAAVQQRLRHWQQDTDFAGVRDAGPLARLPAQEQLAWQKLWADVAATLATAQQQTTPAGKKAALPRAPRND
jgi:WD40 repeat protein/serine/threonine protein kinase